MLLQRPRETQFNGTKHIDSIDMTHIQYQGETLPLPPSHIARFAQYSFKGRISRPETSATIIIPWLFGSPLPPFFRNTYKKLYDLLVILVEVRTGFTGTNNNNIKFLVSI